MRNEKEYVAKTFRKSPGDKDKEEERSKGKKLKVQSGYLRIFI